MLKRKYGRAWAEQGWGASYAIKFKNVRLSLYFDLCQSDVIFINSQPVLSLKLRYLVVQEFVVLHFKIKSNNLLYKVKTK